MSTLKQFSQIDRLFRVACELAETPATRRQASKWQQGRGLAYQHRVAAKQFCATSKWELPSMVPQEEVNDA